MKKSTSRPSRIVYNALDVKGWLARPPSAAEARPGQCPGCDGASRPTGGALGLHILVKVAREMLLGVEYAPPAVTGEPAAVEDLSDRALLDLFRAREAALHRQVVSSMQRALGAGADLAAAWNASIILALAGAERQYAALAALSDACGTLVEAFRVTNALLRAPSSRCDRRRFVARGRIPDSTGRRPDVGHWEA